MIASQESSPTPMKSGLVVEDLHDMQSVYQGLLEETWPGIRLYTVSTVAQALRLVQTTRIDIALIDLGLPDGSGIDVIKFLRQHQAHAQCVVVTIFDDDDHLFPALKAGAHGYLVKDLPREQFCQRLRNISAGEPPLSPAISRRLLAHFAERPQKDPAHELTNREKEVLVLISKGLTLPKVAVMLDISRNTAAGYVKAIYRKLNISSRAEAVIEANKIGLINY